MQRERERETDRDKRGKRTVKGATHTAKGKARGHRLEKPRPIVDTEQKRHRKLLANLASLLKTKATFPSKTETRPPGWLRTNAKLLRIWF